MVRLSHGHIRFGTFQRLAYLGQTENIKKLLDYCIKYFYPELSSFKDDDLAVAFLQAVSKASAQLAASWMAAGFVHGVLNTDNMNISGESFDYGPYRFLPNYDPTFTAAYFDETGLYCYGRQPYTVLWNLHQLGLALTAAFPHLPIEELLEDYSDSFNLFFQKQLLKRLNLRNPLSDTAEVSKLNSTLISALFHFMDQEKVLFEQTLFDLHSGASQEHLNGSPQKEFYLKESFKPLQEAVNLFAVDSKEKESHSYFKREKPCSLIIEELEDIWRPIAEKDDWASFERKLAEIRSFRGIYT